MWFDGDHLSTHGSSQQRVLTNVGSNVDNTEVRILKQQVLKETDYVRLPESVLS